MGVLYARETPQDNFERVGQMGVGNASQSQRGLMTAQDKVKLDNIPTDVADYVVEQGTSGIWHYRKWDSGILEQWGEETITPTSLTQTGDFYYQYITASSFAIPFLTIQSRNISHSGQGGISWVTPFGSSIQNVQILYTRCRNSGLDSFRAEYYYIGTWK